MAPVTATRTSFINESHRLYASVSVSYEALSSDVVRLFQSEASKGASPGTRTAPPASQPGGTGSAAAVDPHMSANVGAMTGDAVAAGTVFTDTHPIRSGLANPGETATMITAPRAPQVFLPDITPVPEMETAAAEDTPITVRVSVPDALSNIEKILWFANNANIFIDVSDEGASRLDNIETFAHENYGDFKRVVVFDSSTLPLDLFYFGPDVLLVDKDALGGTPALVGPIVSDTTINLPHGASLTLIGLIDVVHA